MTESLTQRAKEMFSSTPTVFQPGDRVRTRGKVARIMSGVVHMVCAPEYAFLFIPQSKVHAHLVWREVYPDLLQYPFVSILLDVPQKAMPEEKARELGIPFEDVPTVSNALLPMAEVEFETELSESHLEAVVAGKDLVRETTLTMKKSGQAADSARALADNANLRLNQVAAMFGK